jgi:hypothetical protein
LRNLKGLFTRVNPQALRPMALAALLPRYVPNRTLIDPEAVRHAA